MTETHSSPPAPRSWFERLWSSIAERGRQHASLPAEAVTGLERAKLLAQALLSGRGEASGAALAKELQTVAQRLTAGDRLEFQRYLATDFAPDPVLLKAAAEAYLASPDPKTVATLADTVEPPRQELLRRMNMSPGGTASLVALRKELLGRLKEHPELAPLDGDLRHLLGSWFNRGFLELRRIDWQTQAAVLEKLITYEAVHEIQGWNDLRRRLAPDRRCFGFFHPALPGEPLIFVEVALVEGLAGAVQSLLAPAGDDAEAREREARADTAIFYSISNCQDGLRGVSFGNFLIKQVVEELKAELPNLTRFSTLSPVPGFRRWLEKRLPAEGSDLPALLATERWWEQPPVAETLRPALLRECAVYLTRPPGDKASVDPVARFHLGNGARLEQVNWLGNVAPRGIKESYGIMVNYLYDLPTIESNHEAYVRDGTVVRSAAVDALIAPQPVPGAGRGLRRRARRTPSKQD